MLVYKQAILRDLNLIENLIENLNDKIIENLIKLYRNWDKMISAMDVIVASVGCWRKSKQNAAAKLTRLI